MTLRFLLCAFAIGAMTDGVVVAQEFPTKPIRIVTAEPGGGNDFAARVVAQGLGSLGQPVIVENRPSGVIPGAIVAKAPPDGYTLLAYGVSLWMAPFLQNDIPYDPVRDFAPVTLVASSPGVLVVYPGVPAKSAKELIALAKANPGQLNYASTSTGSPAHLAGELFKFMAGVDIVRISYKGAAAGLIDVMSGRVQLQFGTATSSTPHMKSGKLRALAVTSARPTPVFPGLPTLASTLPGYEAGSTYGVFVPARTPATIVTRLNREIVRHVQTEEVRERFLNVGVDVVGSAPGELAAAIRSDMTRLGKMIRETGIRAE
ncbi:MAG TPA: tripartite tricarboxylate transporter substrate binding protein [Burkholderiales bacterium]|nr:tripartite tricarboxylate transporter substrate binding protein [Burkholderiales bacterium]